MNISRIKKEPIRFSNWLIDTKKDLPVIGIRQNNDTGLTYKERGLFKHNTDIGFIRCGNNVFLMCSKYEKEVIDTIEQYEAETGECVDLTLVDN